MSIQEKITRLENAKADIASAIAEKGVSVPNGTKIDAMASLVRSISSGIDTSDATATEDKVFLDETFYAGGAKKTGTFTIASEISSQDGLISAIKTALQGKASGGGGGSTGEDLTALLEEQEELISTLQETLRTKANGTGGASTPTQEKTVEIKENGTVEVLPDEGYALSKVTANVAVPIPDGYIVPSGTKSITENGTHNVAEYAEVNVNVEASGDDEGTNAQWFADLITDSERTVEVYNDKFEGTLSAYAFYERANVTKIELPNLQYLKERCFFGCQNLKTLLLPNLLGYTYQYMASGCTKLVDVDIHGTSYVSSYTFQSCTSLKKVDLHRVGTIGTNAFNGATKFETLIIRTDTVPSLGGTNAFTNTKIKSGGTGYIYVKSALLDAFKSATNWSTFASQFRAIEDYPEITGG